MRRRVKPSGVAINGDEPHLIADDVTGSVVELGDLLAAKLDECAERDELAWRDCLAIVYR